MCKLNSGNWIICVVAMYCICIVLLLFCLLVPGITNNCLFYCLKYSVYKHISKAKYINMKGINLGMKLCSECLDRFVINEELFVQSALRVRLIRVSHQHYANELQIFKQSESAWPRSGKTRSFTFNSNSSSF